MPFLGRQPLDFELIASYLFAKKIAKGGGHVSRENRFFTVVGLPAPKKFSLMCTAIQRQLPNSFFDML